MSGATWAVSTPCEAHQRPFRILFCLLFFVLLLGHIKHIWYLCVWTLTPLCGVPPTESYLQNNLITSLPAAWSNITSLVHIYLSENNMESPLGDWWTALTNLRQL